MSLPAAAWASVCSCKACLILPFAFVEITNCNQSCLGFWFFDVMISTLSPLLNSCLIGTLLLFTLAPTQVDPTSVCTSNAKSNIVAPAGNFFKSPLGVKTKISLLYKLILKSSIISSASGSGFSKISLIRFIQSSNSCSSFPPLYFQ